MTFSLVNEFSIGEEARSRETSIIKVMTIVLRFLFGVIFAGVVALWSGMPFLLNFIFVIGVGIVAAVWGDKFLLGFMSVMRYLS